MFKKFLLMTTCAAICAMTLGCGGAGSGGGSEEKGKKSVDDAAQQLQKKFAEEGKQ